MTASVLCRCADPHCPYCSGEGPASYLDACPNSPARQDLVRKQRDKYRELAWRALACAQCAIDIRVDMDALRQALKEIESELPRVDR